MFWKKDEDFSEKDFNGFMKELAKQAKKLQEETYTVIEIDWNGKEF